MSDTGLTVSQLVQLYAPLAGLLGLAFWTGMLTQTVRDLRRRVGDLESADGAGKNGERLVRLEVHFENIKAFMEGVERSMQGVQRQLANLMTKPHGAAE